MCHQLSPPPMGERQVTAPARFSVSAEGAAVVHVFAVGPWTATVTFPRMRPGRVNHVTCEWEPAVPNRPFTEAEHATYRAGLSAALRAAREASDEGRT